MDADVRIKMKQEKREETIERQRNELIDKIKRGEEKMLEIERQKEEKIEYMRVKGLEKEKDIEELRRAQKVNEEYRQLDLIEKIRSHEERIKEMEEVKKKEIQERIVRDNQIEEDRK